MEHEWLNLKDQNGDKKYFFSDWVKTLMIDLQTFKTKGDIFEKNSGVDPWKEPRHVKMNDVFDQAGWKELVEAMFAKLNSRPMTLVHHDMNPGNIF